MRADGRPDVGIVDVPEAELVADGVAEFLRLSGDVGMADVERLARRIDGQLADDRMMGSRGKIGVPSGTAQMSPVKWKSRRYPRKPSLN